MVILLTVRFSLKFFKKGKLFDQFINIQLDIIIMYKL